jgi:hypothetical protein
MINLSLIASREEYEQVVGYTDLTISNQCCPVPGYETSLVLRDGHFTCDICGKVKEKYLDDQYHQEGMYTATTGFNPGFSYGIFRYYKPLNHFREHLRRFLGSRPTQMDLSLLHIDIHNPKAFFLIKKQLKQLKMRKEYKNIWSILYKLGGKIPSMDNELFHKVIHYFGRFIVKYPEVKGVRKSVPSHDMLLSAIFEKLGFKPYYLLPIVQSRKIRDNIHNIIKECLG